MTTDGSPPSLCAICNSGIEYPDGSMPLPFSREGILASSCKDLPHLVDSSSEDEVQQGVLSASESDFSDAGDA